MIYKASVNLLENKSNNNLTFEIENKKDKFLLNQAPFEWDLVKIEEGIFHIIHENQSYNAAILQINQEDKTFTIKINQNIYTIQLKDQFDILLDQLGMNQTKLNKISQLKAPMPGLIIDIRVSDNEEVKKGDILIILEAMKMENILKSPTDGIIKKIKVNKGAKVEKNEILIEFQ